MRKIKKTKLPEGMIVNHEERKIIIFESLDKKIKSGDISLRDLRKIMNMFEKYPNYEKTILHFVWLGAIA